MILHKQLHQQTKLANPGDIVASYQSSESGFTIIESLIAVLVLGILLAAIAPVITLSVATRIQARRVEIGTQAARAYIDAVRAGAVVPPKYVVLLDELNETNKTFASDRGGFAGTNAPSETSLNCGITTTDYPYCTNNTTSSLYCIDHDGDGCSSSSLKDLVIQAFRSTTDTSIDDADKGYLLGVRVYRADGFNGAALKNKADDKAKQSTFTGGLGDRQTPLVEITTEIASKTTKFQDYCARFGGCQ